MRHSSEPRDQSERLFRALVKISQRRRPRRGIVNLRSRSGLGNKLAAADVTLRLAIGEVQNNLVDAPAVPRRAVEPHFPRASPQRLRQENWPASKILQLFRTRFVSHEALLPYYS